MHHSKIIALTAFALEASLAVAHPTQNSVLSKRDTKLENLAKEVCEDHDRSQDRYVIVVAFTMNGNIDGGGNPTIEDGAGVVTFDDSCNQVAVGEWNGRSGRLKSVKYRDGENGELRIAFDMEGGALNPDKVSWPANADIGNNEVGWYPTNIPHCSDVTSQTDFPVTSWLRACSFNDGYDPTLT